MKPIREYLAELPAPYNTLALSVVDEKYEGYQVQVESSFDAIRCMCEWRDTPQGHSFWNMVSNWCFAPNQCKLPPIPVEQVEVEQPKTEMESCLDKKLSDNPTIADSIGSHFQLAFEYSEQLVNENTSLRAQLYRLPILEQENTELRADKERIVDLLNKAQITIADLESQLSNLTSLPSQPKTPVYDAEWLANVVKNYDDIYWLSGETVSVGGVTLSPKDSAPIIMAALAKELNGGKVGKEVIWFDAEMGRYDVWEKETPASYGNILFVDAQKAIEILTQLAPQVLKNYFA